MCLNNEMRATILKRMLTYRFREQCDDIVKRRAQLAYGIYADHYGPKNQMLSLPVEEAA